MVEHGKLTFIHTFSCFIKQCDVTQRCLTASFQTLLKSDLPLRDMGCNIMFRNLMLRKFRVYALSLNSTRPNRGLVEAMIPLSKDFLGSHIHKDNRDVVFMPRIIYPQDYRLTKPRRIFLGV